MTKPDPWKGLRGVMAATMILEAIVVGLSLFVVARGIPDGSWQIPVIGVLALTMLLSSGCFRFPWGIPLALALQVLTLAGFFVQVSIGIVGVMFTLVWIYFLWLRRDVARRMAEGRLPSQQ